MKSLKYMLLLLLACGSYSLDAGTYVNVYDPDEEEYGEDVSNTEVYYYNNQPYYLPVGFWGWGYAAQLAWWNSAYPGIAFAGWGGGWRRGGYHHGGRGWHDGHHRRDGRRDGRRGRDGRGGRGRRDGRGRGGRSAAGGRGGRGGRGGHHGGGHAGRGGHGGGHHGGRGGGHHGRR